MVFRLFPTCHNFVHRLQGVGSKKHLSALCANLGWYVAQDGEATFPPVNMLNTPFFNRAFAKRALFHRY